MPAAPMGLWPPEIIPDMLRKQGATLRKRNKTQKSVVLREEGNASLTGTPPHTDDGAICEGISCHNFLFINCSIDLHNTQIFLTVSATVSPDIPPLCASPVLSDYNTQGNLLALNLSWQQQWKEQNQMERAADTQPFNQAVPNSSQRTISSGL